MNARLDLSEIVTKLTSELTAPVPYVAKVTNREYQEKYAKTLPGVWVIGQRARAMDDGGGSGRIRQMLRVEVALHVFVPRYADGVMDNDSTLDALCNDVTDVLKDWRPTGAERNFAWVSYQDGPAHESFLSAVLIFFTWVIYTKPA